MRIGRRVHRSALRTFTSPFADRSDVPLLVHCGHHKAGTVWIRRVILELCRSYGLRYRTGGPRPIASDADAVVFANADEFRRALLSDRSFAGSHMIRDPRDLVVSGYEYHKVTTEAWANQVRPEYGDRSYREYLCRLPDDEGLLAEIRWFGSATGPRMAAWDFDQPEFLELRYEDFLADEHAGFLDLFRWWGLNQTATDRGLEIADRLSRRNGGARSTHPIRSSLPGEWQERFTADHIEEFKSQNGDLLERLGYETSEAW